MGKKNSSLILLPSAGSQTVLELCIEREMGGIQGVGHGVSQVPNFWFWLRW